MADNSISISTLGRTCLADSSIFEAKVVEASKEHLYIGSASNVEEEMPQVETRVIMVQEAGKQEELVKALEETQMSYARMESVNELEGLDSPEFENVFVVPDFQDSVFNDLHKADCRIIGPPVLLSCAQKGEPLPFSCRPLYCTSMMNLVLCFTGFRKKEELVRLVTLVHHMGGVIRKDFNSKVTHLVANCTEGEKFRVAVSLGTPIVKPEWIYKAWERRDEQNFCAAVDDFRNEFKVPPFQDCILSFLGFSDEERTNMEEMTEMQGGNYLPVGDERCTHLIVEENTVKELPFEPSKKLYVVKQEWFWGSIQMDARAGETMYFYHKANTPELKKSVSLLSLNTPNSNRKRRRLKETLAQLSRETDMSPFPPRKRPSAEHSLSIGSLLDISNTPESSINCGGIMCTMELEHYIQNNGESYFFLFQVPLEEEGQRGGPILAPEEIKTIFGSIPDIFDVHTKIKDDLEDLIVNWDESKSIGDIFLKYSKDLVKTYPPFVNFFEMSKETIIKCEKQKPRFHAFLKINQAKPECGRQSLVELLIRPVQRLPSVALLLNDLKKHTADENPDKSTLEKAIGSLKEVMTHINEDKRKTEAQKQIFDVVYEVDGCPANLLSSHRSLVQRVETISLGEYPCDRGEQVTLFLFNDCLEIARKRHKVIGTFKSPPGHTRPPASLKHIHLMPLSQIKKVLDIRETEDCHNAFALLVRPPTEQANVLLSFQMTSDDLPKENWLKMLCRHVANTICKADAENLIYTADPESFEVNTKDMDSTLSRASRAIKKTSKKVTRAFSFSKTPRRALRLALMPAHSSAEGRSPDKHTLSRLSSTSSLAGIPSPSLVSLPSFFERRSHTLSRSTTHLI
ncbi:PREDICTED: protein ECT2 [Dipodomys ordii]|uniref:Protein ECT2 n=1 Tax=Dipodomys ordii TaxID=10020 RepID=A0A1S3F704_DIPOR|nr:PREDICTED: protein ECT2 [Dipodomys ordii]